MSKIKRSSLGNNQLWWLETGFGSHGATSRAPQDVETAIEGNFVFAEEKGTAKGLRIPQAGALHALLAQESVGVGEPTTIVMPTGTGKTETMLAAYCHSPKLTVVIVPSDSLRTQIGEKFATLGVLPKLGVVSDGALTPVVGVLKSYLTTPEQASELLEKCNVLVATAAALSGSEPLALAKVAEMSEQLFVDEAHHVAARTWRAIADAFEGRRVVQFTATPFREDGQYMGGKIGYAYPLRLAQAEGYFAPINYHAITDVTDPDRAVATAAVAQLRNDIDAGLDHILMARVRGVPRAKELLELYEGIAADLAPIRIDSKMADKKQKAGHAALKARTSRIVVCVDMLGEGFDLPALKIAAIHDPHKSLGVSLQFIGRFARVGGDELGEAHAFVPRQIGLIDDRLRELYAEDSDWNAIVRDLTQSEVEQEQARSEFEGAFTQTPEEISVRSLRPKMSTVVYQATDLRWDPNAAYDIFDEDQLYTKQIAINNTDSVLWFVTAEHSPVPWGEFRNLSEIVHHFYLVHCDTASGLLYINSSNNGSNHEALAKAIGGPNVKIIKGDVVYRVLHGVNRRVPTNVGLLDAVSRNRRFAMLVGANVVEGFDPSAAQKSKTNIFAHGYDGSTRITFGAARKGRIWSHQVANTLLDWVKWAKGVGATITDDSIDLTTVMNGFIIPKAATERPELVPLGIEWPYMIIETLSENRMLTFNGQQVPLIDVDLAITDWGTTGPIQFELRCDDWTIDYQMTFDVDGPKISAVGTDGTIDTMHTSSSLADYMTKNGMTIFFEKEALLSPDGYLLQPDRRRPRYESGRLQVIDWTGIDLRKESQGPARAADSIQYKVTEELAGEDNWDVIIDDDGTREMADIVLLRRDGRDLHILMAHCKFSSEDLPGARVDDLYEVCGQAIKSHKARSEAELVLKNLIRRETRKQKRGATGLIKGSIADLMTLADTARALDVRVTVLIAQPGVSKAALSHAQSELLACTESYLRDTYGSELRVITSP